MADRLNIEVKGSVERYQDLLEIARLSQRENNCLLRRVCPFLLEYQHILFCISEILGGCQIERQRADSLHEA
jgi:hypothetical protein